MRKEANSQEVQADSVDQNVHVFVKKIEQITEAILEAMSGEEPPGGTLSAPIGKIVDSILGVLKQLDAEAPDLMQLLDSIKGKMEIKAVPGDETNEMLNKAVDSLVAARLATKYFEAGQSPATVCTFISLTGLGETVSDAHKFYTRIKDMVRNGGDRTK